ncbi:MAG: glycosyltransferase family 4 protein [Gammaproteobacteria bacterium]|nr:glycosyltransferase family 4 protein [Gammaproteobacteria bacterium]
MKILEICMSKGFGGLELYVVKVAKYLKENDYNYSVVTKEESFLSKTLTENKISNYNLQSVLHLLPLISAIKLAIYIQKNNIDILHIHWGKDLFFAVLAKIFSRRKIKLVYTKHMSLTRHKNDIYHRFLYGNVDAYLVITKALFNDALKYLPIKKEKVHLLYHGVPAANINKDVCYEYITKIGMDKNTFKLAIFGRVEKGKGQHLVIKAVNNLIKKGLNIQLAIIGNIMDEIYFKQLKADIENNNLANNIFTPGFHNKPTSIMPCFDAVVLATKCETFGLVLPEAMRAGVTVVGTNCGGVPEIIEHNKTGLLFEPENSEDLTNQLSKLVDDKEFCNRLAIAGKKDADERFSEEIHFEKLMGYFESS